MSSTSLTSKNKEIEDLKSLVSEKDSEIIRLNEWIDRLLEYTELSKEDLRKTIESKQKVADALSLFSVMSKITGQYL
jgi:predicted RNase H-like nuclease (RuvC/YqgF family)